MGCCKECAEREEAVLVIERTLNREIARVGALPFEQTLDVDLPQLVRVRDWFTKYGR